MDWDCWSWRTGWGGVHCRSVYHWSFVRGRDLDRYSKGFSSRSIPGNRHNWLLLSSRHVETRLSANLSPTVRLAKHSQAASSTQRLGIPRIAKSASHQRSHTDLTSNNLCGTCP